MAPIPTLIPATVADLLALRALCIQTFTDTYAHANTPENMANYLAENFSEAQLRAELQNPDCAYYFALIDDQPVGYIKVNFAPAQTELRDPSSLEIERIYVLQEYKGRKIGQQLLAQARALAVSHGLDFIWLGVWEENPAAIEFYKKSGFTIFGTHVFTLGGEEQTDFLMKLPV
ncbi:MAG: GNAT family N-acetyltransferase [Saprospiraceae bacterium]|nr:GNAT family N-acetyltransferase [Saprospiraceae bacterium]